MTRPARNGVDVPSVFAVIDGVKGGNPGWWNDCGFRRSTCSRPGTGTAPSPAAPGPGHEGQSPRHRWPDSASADRLLNGSTPDPGTPGAPCRTRQPRGLRRAPTTEGTDRESELGCHRRRGTNGRCRDGAAAGPRGASGVVRRPLAVRQRHAVHPCVDARGVLAAATVGSAALRSGAAGHPPIPPVNL